MSHQPSSNPMDANLNWDPHRYGPGNIGYSMKQDGVPYIGIAMGNTYEAKRVTSTPGFPFYQGGSIKEAIYNSNDPSNKSFKLGAFEEAFTVTQVGDNWVDAKNSTMECCGARTTYFIIVGVVETATNPGLAHTAVLKAAQDAIRNGV